MVTSLVTSLVVTASLTLAARYDGFRNSRELGVTQAIARRKAIYEELHPETRHGGDRKSDQACNLQTRSFVDATAGAVGKDKSTVSRAAARGEALGDDLKAIEGTSPFWGHPVRSELRRRALAIRPQIEDEARPTRHSLRQAFCSFLS